ncbi:MAG: hypothetical protein QM644_13940 [Mobilitalea sp.]
MKKIIFLISLVTLLLASCSVKANNQKELDETPPITQTTNPTTVPTPSTSSPTPTTAPPDIINNLADGIQLDLSDTSSILIKNISNSQGITISGRQEIDKIAKSISKFEAYNDSNEYVNEYDYSLTFLSKEGGELATIKVYANQILSINDKLYYDEYNQIGLYDIRSLYIKKIKESFQYNNTGFELNGISYTLKDRDKRITSLEESFLFSDAYYAEPKILLIGSTDFNESYLGVFDVEKLDYVTETFGTNIIWKNDPANSLVYVHENAIYNLLGNIIYKNNDDEYSISSLEFDEEMYMGVIITLSNSNNESKQIKRLNYIINKDDAYINEQKSLGALNTVGEFEADLTHDGILEKLKISKSNVNDFVILEVMDSADNILLMEQAHTSHAGWNSIYLCKIDGQEYLFVFSPYASTGIAEFIYAVYHLNQKGSLSFEDSGYYYFNYNTRIEESAFDEKEFRIFADKVNYYLKQSYLLISTENGELIYSTPENKITDFSEYQTDEWIKTIKSLLF